MINPIPPPALHRGILRHTPSLSLKEVSLLILELQPEEQAFKIWHISSDIQRCYKEYRCRCSLGAFSVLLQLTSVSKKSLYTYLEPLFLSPFPRGTSRLPGSGGQWGLCLWSHTTLYIWLVLNAAVWGYHFQ